MKLTSTISTVLIATIAIFAISCEQEEDCEKYNHGTVVVENNTSTKIVVDVTYGSSEMNDERWINPGSFTTYKDIDAGSITLWASTTGYQHTWHTRSYTLSACEEYTYTWTGSQ